MKKRTKELGKALFADVDSIKKIIKEIFSLPFNRHRRSADHDACTCASDVVRVTCLKPLLAADVGRVEMRVLSLAIYC